MKHLVIFSGAGISAESGISTFRDSGGLWEKHDINLVANICSWDRHKDVMLDFYNERRRELEKARPNLAHKIIAELESDFRVTVITQNVDNLHERAGSTHVIHLHGELTKACNEDKTEVIDIGYNDILLGQKASDGSQLRPFIVWFGEAVPMYGKAAEIMTTADIVIVVGTSLQVQPAAGLLRYIPDGATCYLIDPQPTARYGSFTILEKKASDGMAELKKILIGK